MVDGSAIYPIRYSVTPEQSRKNFRPTGSVSSRNNSEQEDGTCTCTWNNTRSTCTVLDYVELKIPYTAGIHNEIK